MKWKEQIPMTMRLNRTAQRMDPDAVGEVVVDADEDLGVAVVVEEAEVVEEDAVVVAMEEEEQLLPIFRHQILG